MMTVVMMVVTKIK